MKVDNQDWTAVSPADYARTLRAAGGSLRVVHGDGSGVAASGGLGLRQGEAMNLDADEEYAIRAWQTAEASAEIV